MRNKLDGAREVSLEVGHDEVEVITRESGGHGSGTTSGRQVLQVLDITC